MRENKTKFFGFVLAAAIIAGGVMLAQSYEGGSPSTVIETANIESFSSNATEVAGLIEGSLGGPRGTQGSLELGAITYMNSHGFVPLGNETAAFTGSFRNTFGKTIYLTGYDFVMANTTDSASSTYKLIVATSTTATLAYNSSLAGTIIDTATIATGTDESVVFNMNEHQGTNGKQVVPVQADEYVVYLIKVDDEPANCTGVSCENATSTNRGFEALWTARYYLVTDVNP